MKLNRPTSISLSPDESAILAAIAARKGISKSEVIRHLLLYQAMCGGDFPLTSRILKLNDPDREAVIADLRRRAENYDPYQPQAFRRWVKEVVGSDDDPTTERGSDRVLRSLLDCLGGPFENHRPSAA